MLLDAGANPKLKNADGLTALGLAAKHDANKIIQLLVDGGLDVNAKDASGRTALHMAAAGRKMEATRKLLKLGGQTECARFRGATLLYTSP